MHRRVPRLVDALPPAGDGDFGPVEVTAFDGQAFLPSDGGPFEVDQGQSWLVFGQAAQQQPPPQGAPT